LEGATSLSSSAVSGLLAELDSLKQRVATLDAEQVALRSAEDQMLRTIVEGTASVTGDEFFRALVSHLALGLGVRVAFVAEFADVRTRVRTLAFWDQGAICDNVEWDLEGTPCETIVSGEFCHFVDHVAELFPRDRPLAEKGIRGFMGVPLLAESGDTLGHLAIGDTKPMPPEPRFLSVFKIFADRARAELERKWAQKALQESEAQLAGILASTLDAIATVDRDGRITLFNAAAERVFGMRAGEVLGQPLATFLTPPFSKIIGTAIARAAVKDAKGPHRYILAEEGITARRSDGTEFPVEGTISHVRVSNQDLYTIIIHDINDRKQAEAELQILTRDVHYLREEIESEFNFEEMVGTASAFQKVIDDIRSVAPTDSTVLITGETGTGKELAARAVHNLSARRDRPLVKVNCVALSLNLVESELFGHEKGSFTGALAKRIGRFELADGGTIFLDEIGDIPKEVQVKLLRVLQEKEFERVGGTDTLRTDVRVIAATNRDLAKAVKEGQFREDLYYRLNVVPLRLPPLRDRKEDIPLLVRFFVDKYAARIGKRFSDIEPATMERLLNYLWPGNARELEHLIERAIILCPVPTLRIGDNLFPEAVDAQPMSLGSGTLEDVERDHIVLTLEKTRWVIEGKKGAAILLNMHPNTLRSRMRKLNIVRPPDEA
jgi:PAS domain S-box-containing protein